MRNVRVAIEIDVEAHTEAEAIEKARAFFGMPNNLPGCHSARSREAFVWQLDGRYVDESGEDGPFPDEGHGDYQKRVRS